MKKKIAILFSLILGLTINSIAQEDDSLYYSGMIQTVTIKSKKRVNWRYNNMLARVKRVYPYVLEADRLYSQYEETTASLSKKRKVKKFGRQQNKQLKDDFTYAFKSMSRRDGVVMMKLIEHSTNKTTYDIIKKYRGKPHADMVNSAGKLFNQNFKVKLIPSQDTVLLRIYNEIQSGKTKVPTKIIKISKEEYRNKEKASRKKSRANRKRRRITKRTKRLEGKD